MPLLNHSLLLHSQGLIEQVNLCYGRNFFKLGELSILESNVIMDSCNWRMILYHTEIFFITYLYFYPISVSKIPKLSDWHPDSSLLTQRRPSSTPQSWQDHSFSWQLLQCWNSLASSDGGGKRADGTSIVQWPCHRRKYYVVTEFCTDLNNSLLSSSGLCLLKSLYVKSHSLRTVE